MAARDLRQARYASFLNGVEVAFIFISCYVHFVWVDCDGKVVAAVCREQNDAKERREESGHSGEKNKNWHVILLNDFAA